MFFAASSSSSLGCAVLYREIARPCRSETRASRLRKKGTRWPVRRLPILSICMNHIRPFRPHLNFVARCCPSDRQPLAPRRQPAFVTGDGNMPSLHASRCSTCPYFQPVPVPPWRRQCRARPSRDASVERTTTTTTMHVIGSVAAIKMMFGTATIGPAQTHLASMGIVQKEIKPVAAAVTPVPFDYRSA